MNLTFTASVMIGFLGSTHCIGMCGGIVNALNAGLPAVRRQSNLLRSLHHAAYNTGRITSYTIAGALAGLAGSQAQRFPVGQLLPVGTIVAGLFLIALGLYLAGWWRAIAGLENIGKHVWTKIQPLGKRFLPVRHPVHAFALGLVWGWLPCGLVYSALALAVISGSSGQGAFLMFGFGLGTLPMLLAVGQVSDRLAGLVRKPLIRQLSGGLIILFGISMLLMANVDHTRHIVAPAGSGTALSSAYEAFSLVFSKLCLTPG